jgi:hypothetical protein
LFTGDPEGYVKEGSGNRHLSYLRIRLGLLTVLCDRGRSKMAQLNLLLEYEAANLLSKCV